MPDNAPQGSEPAQIVHPDATTIDLDKFFGPPIPATTSGPPPVVASNPAPEPEPVKAEPVPEPAKVEPPKPEVESEIAAALREMREERTARDKIKEEAQSWRGKYEAVTAELEAVKRSPSFEDDPIAYARARKWTPEQQTEIVQLLAYDIAPDKAPEALRFKLLDKRQEAKLRMDREEREAREREAAEQRQYQATQQFARGLDAAAGSFAPGAYPANEDWYGDNRLEYVTDLFNLANSLAEEAAQRGTAVDLSAAALAANLEKRNAARLAALEQRRGKRSPKAAEPVQPAGGAQSTGSPASTRGLNQGGPRPPAATEDERVKRAIEAAFAPVR